MKKLLLFIFISILSFSLVGCTERKSTPNTNEATTDTNSREEPHIHNYTTKVIAPTCTDEGYTTYTCNCGDSYISDKKTTVEHNWGEWLTTKEPTKTATGSAEHICSYCNSKETKVLGRIIKNHTHNFTSKTTKSATCNQEGKTTFSCSCGETYTETIAKSNHSYTKSVTNPTCTNGGYTTYTCSCGDSYVSNKTSSSGHSFSEWKVDVAATTPETETAFRKCSICNTKETKTLAHNHNYESTITLTALCNREGIRKYSCNSCGHTYTEPIAKLSSDGTHTYDEGQIISPPTCAITGKKKYTCIYGDSYYYETIPATGNHIYSKINIIIKATCTRNGTQEVSCKNCSDWYRETIPQLEHNYVDGVCTLCGSY